MNFANVENEALDAIQPKFQFGRATYIGATLLHRLTLHRDLATITRRKNELNTNLLNSVCKRMWNEYTWSELTPFYIACYTNQEGLALLLLEHGNPDPNILLKRQDPSGDIVYCAAIWWAASHGLVSLCRALLRHGARADIGEDPLKQAKNKEILNMLCDHRKVSPELYMEEDKVNLQEDPLGAIQTEFELGRATFHGATLLHRLVQMKDVTTLIKRKGELMPGVADQVCERRWPARAKDHYAWTQLSALNLACWTNQEEIAMLLLEGKADPNILCERTNLSGKKLSSTALWWAACHGKADLCRELLKHGARADIGESPLNEAASEEIRDIILNSLK